MEELNTNIYVFTTKYVLEKKSPILFVSHEENGDWQFLGPESNLKEDAARIVSLSEILDVDPSLNEILNLPFGKEIKRDKIGSEWISL